MEPCGRGYNIITNLRFAEADPKTAIWAKASELSCFSKHKWYLPLLLISQILALFSLMGESITTQLSWEVEKQNKTKEEKIWTQYSSLQDISPTCYNKHDHLLKFGCFLHQLCSLWLDVFSLSIIPHFPSFYTLFHLSYKWRNLTDVTIWTKQNQALTVQIIRCLMSGTHSCSSPALPSAACSACLLRSGQLHAMTATVLGGCSMMLASPNGLSLLLQLGCTSTNSLLWVLSGNWSSASQCLDSAVLHDTFMTSWRVPMGWLLRPPGSAAPQATYQTTLSGTPLLCANSEKTLSTTVHPSTAGLFLDAANFSAPAVQHQLFHQRKRFTLASLVPC